jgi:DNA-binding HxlR family transcriptional regulator
MASERESIDETRSYGQTCPIARTLDILGDRWTLLIVRDLFLGRKRYHEFMEGSPGIPARMLSERLKKLERHGLIERVIYSEHPLRAEYHLTPLGESLEPVIRALAAWGLDHRLDGEERRRVRGRLRARGIEV